MNDAEPPRSRKGLYVALALVAAVIAGLILTAPGVESPDCLRDCVRANSDEGTSKESTEAMCADFCKLQLRFP